MIILMTATACLLSGCRTEGIYPVTDPTDRPVTSVQTVTPMPQRDEAFSTPAAVTLLPTPKPLHTKRTVTEMYGLTNIRAIAPDIQIDMRYAGSNNLTGAPVYPCDACVLQRETAEKLAMAQQLFAQDGYCLLIWDAYRPQSYHEILYYAAPLEQRNYFADPAKGSNHSRGTAVDCTLLYADGTPVEMPTDFDELSTLARRYRDDRNEDVQANVDYFTQIMNSVGLVGVASEWWHFNDVNAADYPLSDHDITVFIE